MVLGDNNELWKTLFPVNKRTLRGRRYRAPVATRVLFSIIVLGLIVTVSFVANRASSNYVYTDGISQPENAPGSWAERRRLTSSDAEGEPKIDHCKPPKGEAKHFMTIDNPFDNAASGIPALLCYMLALIFLFVGIASVTDEMFVPALMVMSAKMKLSEDVAGATLMASASSAPELFTNIVDTFFMNSNVGIGTIVGSAVFNILVIIACTGALAHETLLIDWKPLTRDIFFYCASIIMLLSFVELDGTNGEIETWEGFSMFGFYIVYVLFMSKNDFFMDCLDSCCGGGANKEAGKSDEENPTAGVEMAGGAAPTTAAKWAEEARRAKVITVKGIPDMSEEERKSLEMNMTGFSQAVEISLASDGKTYYCHFENIVGDEKREMMNDVIKKVLPNDWEGVEVITGMVSLKATGDDDSEDEGSPGCLMMIIGGCNDAWMWTFNWTIPDVNSEDLQEQRDETTDEAEIARLDEQIEKKEKWYAIAFLNSILWIAVICYIMVFMVEKVGCILGIPPVVMGLTLLAAGTSIPDALGSVDVARQGMGDMAVANAIGSNVFDILIGLGLPWGLKPLLTPDKFVVNTDESITLFISILFGTVIMVLGIFMCTGWKLGRTVGLSLFGLYFVFVVFAIVYNFAVLEA